jgi:hypothetical protein
MRYVRLVSLSVLSLLAFSASSFAGRVNMTFENIGPGNQIGGEYTYPYYFSINHSNTYTPLICDTHSNSITFGQKWKANVSSLLSASGLWMNEPGALNDYKAAAIIFSEILNKTVIDGQAVTSQDGNLAIWALFDGGSRSNSGWTNHDQNLIDIALASTSQYHTSFYRHFQVYTPVGAKPGFGPQEFIGYDPNILPEPMSLTIMGSGLAAMSLLLRQKRG